MRKIKFLSFGIILFLLIQTLNIYSLENRIVISVGNQPITHLDLVKEMHLQKDSMVLKKVLHMVAHLVS